MIAKPSERGLRIIKHRLKKIDNERNKGLLGKTLEITGNRKTEGKRRGKRDPLLLEETGASLNSNQKRHLSKIKKDTES